MGNTEQQIIPTPDNPLYGVSTVAKMFDVKSTQVRIWINEGKMKGYMIGGRWRIQHSDVVEFANKEYGA